MSCFLNFHVFGNKVTCGIKFAKISKKLMKVQVSTVRLNDRSSTYNQSIEKLHSRT